MQCRQWHPQPLLADVLDDEDPSCIALRPGTARPKGTRHARVAAATRIYIWCGRTKAGGDFTACCCNLLHPTCATLQPHVPRGPACAAARRRPRQPRPGGGAAARHACDRRRRRGGLRWRAAAGAVAQPSAMSTMHRSSHRADRGLLSFLYRRGTGPVLQEGALPAGEQFHTFWWVRR
jgi:hypothetical protein